MASPAIRVENLSKRYRIGAAQQRHDTLRDAISSAVAAPFRRNRNRATTADEETLWALKDVSFDVQPGEVVGIIGRNGAGKSTLLKILSRITEPTTGRVEIRGRVASLLEVGTGFHSELTGRENVYLNGAILGMARREIDRKFDEIVAFAEVERFIDTPVKRYSSGMYLRLAFAVAAHLEPEILIVDEVLAVGDAGFQAKCLGKMKDVAISGRTVLFVSHNEAAVRRLSTWAVLLDHGIVRITGTPEDVFQSYRSRDIAMVFNAENRCVSSPTLEIADAYLAIDGIPTSEVVAGRRVTITLVVEVNQRTRFSPELLVRDFESMPILFAPIGLSSGTEYDLPEGRHALTFALALPILAAGRYSIDLMLAETNVRFYDYVQEALAFDVQASNNRSTGWQFNQSKGQGCILLDAREVGKTEATEKVAACV